MTKKEREDAIEFFKKIAEKEVDNAKYSKLAIEALNQGIVLEQIRGEIEEERDKVYQNRQGCDTYYADGLDTALDIIDKYTK